MPIQPTPTSLSADDNLHDAVEFFIGSRCAKLQQTLDAIDARRRELDAEEQRAKEAAREQLRAFLRLLEESGKPSLPLDRHAAFLRRIGMPSLD